MDSVSLENRQAFVPDFLSGGGEMGQRIREYDWSRTTLGPIENWPRSLRTCIRIMLSSRQPIWIGWGKDLIKLYNDPYKAIVGGKHPWALGMPASVVWKDIWKDIQPMLEQVMERDEGTYVEAQLLIMERNGYPEETYYTFSYTPIPGDDGGTAGMICANTDDTDRIISERQLRTLTQLAKHLTDCHAKEEIIHNTIQTLKENPYDFPFALFRAIVNNKAVLMDSTELLESWDLVPKEIDLNEEHPVGIIIKKAIDTGEMQVFDEVTRQIGNMPKGSWEVSPEKAIVLPLYKSGFNDPFGLLVVGLNPYRILDEKYSGFFQLVSDQVANSFADVHVLHEERKRAEALAEIDRAKTTFFSNISHEFRTPLTLLLGPIEELLNDNRTIADNRTRLDIAYRNARRMEKLVNTLLEFSRIEAGRFEGNFSAIDVCVFTEDLVSSFRAAVEKAGMQLIFRSETIRDEVYVDPDMWEKIVLNLVSNAFKYSNEGSIEVTLKQVGADVLLTVTDTGIGIPENMLEKIFDRFHRIENIHGRSQEGTGIGLAMVKELVKLHHGSIFVESVPGKGSSFTIAVPTGRKHLADNRILPSQRPGIVSKNADVFIQEAMKWIPGQEQENENIPDEASVNGILPPTVKKQFTVILADDNADMRQYVQRLLSKHFRVITAKDGEEAFSKVIETLPDLLITDVMMPRLPGFELLKKIRNHPDLKNLPVIFLSARSGEEAKIEGLDAGADDYLVKPFSSKELLARVEGNIKIAQSRIAAERRMRDVIRQMPVATTLLRGTSFVIEIVNELGLELWGKEYKDVINRPLLEVLPELIRQGFDQLLLQVYVSGESYRGYEVPVELVRSGKPEKVYLNFIYEPLKDGINNEVTGIIAVAVDVSEQVNARKKIEESQRDFQLMANALPQLVWVANADGNVYYYNDRIVELSGVIHENGRWIWEGLVHPEDAQRTEKAWKKSIQTGATYQVEHRIKMKDGSYRWFLSRGFPNKNENGDITKWFGTATDIHVTKEYAQVLEEEVKKRTNELYELNNSLQQSNNELQQFAHVASHDLKEPLRKIKTFTKRLVDDAGNIFSDKSKLYISKVNSASDRMQMMIEGVLDYSMLNSKVQGTQPVDLNEIISQIKTDLELLIDQHAATIQSDKLPVIEGAAVLIYQLFYNLINNSLKFSKKDVPALIHISSDTVSENNELYAVLKVTDNGIGFEQAYADSIFTTFTRLNSKDQYEGTGLGLSLCKRIVERHTGHINAIGRPGEGATFILHLPFKQQIQNL